MKSKRSQQRKISQQKMTVIPKPTALPPAEPAKPTAETLAMIAATLGQDAIGNPSAAIDYAYKLYQAANQRLKREAYYSPQIEARARQISEIPKPPKFPASLSDFFRLIVKARTPAYSSKRFCDFLRALETHKPVGTPLQGSALDRAVSENLAKFKNDGITEDLWVLLAGWYSKWWASQKSIKAREAATAAKKLLDSPRSRANPTSDRRVIASALAKTDSAFSVGDCARLNTDSAQPGV